MGDTGNNVMSFLGLAPSNPNDPFAPPPISGRELLFRTVASSLPPPGRLQVPNTVGGRLLGTGARLIGGFSDTVADELARQRFDPLQRQLAIAQSVLQNGGQAPAVDPNSTFSAIEPGAQGGFAPVPMAPGQGGFAPTVKTASPFAGVTPQMLVASSALPALKPFVDPTQVVQRQYLQRKINEPIAQGENTTLRDPNDPTKIIAEGTPSFAEREKERYDQLHAQLSQDVAALQQKDPTLTTEQATNKILQDPKNSAYREIPTTYPLPKAAYEARIEDRQNRIMTERDKLAQAREDARQREMQKREDIRFNRQLDTTVLPGVFADRQTGEVRQITRGEAAADKGGKQFKRISANEAATVDLLGTTMPIIDRMQELVPKVLAKNPSRQLGALMSNYAAHKMGYDPDLQELMQLGTALSVEQARALSGSSRVLGGIFNAVKGESVPGITVTAKTAQRQLQIGKQEIQNRINSIVGKPMQKIGPPPEAAAGNPYANMSDDELKKLLSK